MVEPPDVRSPAQKFDELPFPVKVVLVTNLLFIIINVVLAWSLLPVKLDQGLATLAGAVIGLCVVAWQTNRGFQNLIRSQENQAELERAGRLHQAEIDASAAERRRIADKDVLLSAIRAEVVYLYGAASEAATRAIMFKIMYEEMERDRSTPPIKSLHFPTFDAPIYRANISHLGLIGPSLGADVIKVLSRADGKDKNISLDAPISPRNLIVIHRGNADMMQKWASDLYHVATRLQAAEQNTAEPGTLAQTERSRYGALTPP